MARHDLDRDYLAAVATKFGVLGDLFTALREPAAVTELVDTLASGDARSFGKFLERFGADKIPVFPPATPCLVVADFVFKVFNLGTRVMPVTVLREPLTLTEVLMVYNCQRRTGGTRRSASVVVPPSLMPTQRTVVEGNDFIECLQRNNLVENGEVRDEQQIEVRIPTGDLVSLCPPPGRPT
jgi:hypothetical protein